MSKPTPRPWKAKANDKFMDFFAGGQRIFRTAFDERAVHCSKANAAHIVKCVNMHDELVAVLKTLTFNADMATHFIPHVLLEEAVKAAKEILAQTGGD